MDLTQILQWWSFVFLGVIVYAGGEGVKRVFPKIASQAWYQRTIVFHAPVIATGLAALPIFPMPEAIGDGIGARLLFGCVAGIACSWSYKAFMRLLGKDTKHREEPEEEASQPTEK
jgi:hypothetical protein